MLSIIIINYNTKILTQQCIDSICLSTPTDFDYEVIVVDNSSDYKQIFEESSAVKVIKTENKGFGHACNVGAKAACGDVLLMLNSDTIITDNSIAKAYNALNHP